MRKKDGALRKLNAPFDFVYEELQKRHLNTGEKRDNSANGLSASFSVSDHLKIIMNSLRRHWPSI
jgi:hypothetical protein